MRKIYEILEFCYKLEISTLMRKILVASLHVVRSFVEVSEDPFLIIMANNRPKYDVYSGVEKLVDS